MTPPLWPNDVFLSFRGADTRPNFTDHLYAALKRKGLITFRDDEGLEKGESISELLTAIEESRYVIAIISSNYADSKWCLEELAKAVECKNTMAQKLLPVFYHVDPSELRKQTATALSKHQQDSQVNTQMLQRWRDALSQVSLLSGWHVEIGPESKVIEDISEKIFNELNKTISNMSRDLVGMDCHMKEMYSCSKIGQDDVRFIGIWGMGGLGKTTIARLFYERIREQYKFCSFVANVQEVSEKQGLVHVQKQLLCDVLSESNVTIYHPDTGSAIIQHRLCTKKVLIVLDDVNELEQLEALCDEKSWFGAGSRIIITSRNNHVLAGVDNVYKIKELTEEEALRVFSLKAFKKDHIDEEDEFLELSKSFVTYTGGLPLALKVLGSFLFKRSKVQWQSELSRLKEQPDKKIINVLKVSFDGLEVSEKTVFLDIACFFKGEDKDRVTRILESNYCHPVIDISVLIEKSLVTLLGRKLWMHDMIQDLGWEMVREEGRREPGKRSRLWLPKDIIPLLVNNKGTTAVESILLSLPQKKEVPLKIDPFLKMDQLRLLKIRNGNFSGNVEYLSNELQLLEWHECPLDCLPSNFESDKLVELNLYSSFIK